MKIKCSIEVLFDKIEAARHRDPDYDPGWGSSSVKDIIIDTDDLPEGCSILPKAPLEEAEDSQLLALHNFYKSFNIALDKHDAKISERILKMEDRIQEDSGVIENLLDTIFHMQTCIKDLITSQGKSTDLIKALEEKFDSISDNATSTKNLATILVQSILAWEETSDKTYTAYGPDGRAFTIRFQNDGFRAYTPCKAGVTYGTLETAEDVCAQNYKFLYTFV